jgi:hypothetical protein
MAYGDRGVGVAAGFVSALLVAAGVVAAGWFVGKGFENGRTQQSYVTVKGLAEREVQADLALWPIKFQASGNDLALIQEEIEVDLGTISAFLRNAGFAPGEVQTQGLQVNDFGMGYGDSRPVERYAVIQTVLVRSGDVELMADVSRRLGELLRQGIVLQQDWQATGPTYLFTGLNSIKPEMIAEATAAAREAANQFAQDSGAALGGIRTADQGVFQILPRDQLPVASETEQIYKIVRVVSTISYNLDD